MENNYEFQTIRNADPYTTKEIALSVLNSFAYHKVGQLICLTYYTNVTQGTLATITAIGKKNSSDAPVGETGSGPNYYDILNNNDNTIIWNPLV